MGLTIYPPGVPVPPPTAEPAPEPPPTTAPEPPPAVAPEVASDPTLPRIACERLLHGDPPVWKRERIVFGQLMADLWASGWRNKGWSQARLRTVEVRD